MNLNATFLAQMVVFFVLWWVIAKYMWPNLMKTLDARALKISEGLAAAEKGKADFAALQLQMQQEKEKARIENTQRIADSEKRAQTLAEEIKQQAQAEAERIIAQAKTEAEQQAIRIRDTLRSEVAILAVKGAEQILRKEIDAQAHHELLNQLKAEL